MPESTAGYQAILSYFHTVNPVETAPEEPQETTQEVTSSQEVTINPVETVEAVEPVEIDVFQDRIAKAITPVPTDIQIGAEYLGLVTHFPQYVTAEKYCKVKRITQPHLMKCIRKFEQQ